MTTDNGFTVTSTTNLDNNIALQQILANQQLLMGRNNQKHWDGEHIPFTDYMEKWFKGKEVDITANTLSKYRSHYNNHIKLFFKDMMLTDLNFDNVQEFVRNLNDKIQPCTIRDIIYSIMMPALNEAVRPRRLIEFNPCEGVHIPKIKKGKPKQALSNEEIQSLVVASKGHHHWIALPLLAETGMRREELLALTWDDVDFDANIININKTYIVIHGKAVLNNYTKTDNSVRRVHISDKLASLMKIYKEKTQDNQKKYVIAQKINDKRVDPNNFSGETIGKWKKKAGITRSIGTHLLRHSYVTNMILEGADYLTIMEQAGYGDERMIKRYADTAMLKPLQKDSANKIHNHYEGMFDAYNFVG
jgi:integrase